MLLKLLIVASVMMIVATVSWVRSYLKGIWLKLMNFFPNTMNACFSVRLIKPAFISVYMISGIISLLSGSTSLLALTTPLANWLRDISNMRDLTNMKAVLSAPPSFLASLASTGLFRLKLIVGDPWKAIVEIEFKHEPKLDVDWTSKLPFYDSK